MSLHSWAICFIVGELGMVVVSFFSPPPPPPSSIVLIKTNWIDRMIQTPSSPTTTTADAKSQRNHLGLAHLQNESNQVCNVIRGHESQGSQVSSNGNYRLPIAFAKKYLDTDVQTEHSLIAGKCIFYTKEAKDFFFFSSFQELKRRTGKTMYRWIHSMLRSKMSLGVKNLGYWAKEKHPFNRKKPLPRMFWWPRVYRRIRGHMRLSVCNFRVQTLSKKMCKIHK